MTTAPTRGVAPRVETLFTLAFGLFGWMLGLARLSDNSFFWHLRTGELILDHGIPRSDPYSYTAHGVRWVAQSWLAELLYGVIDRTVGAFGIQLLTAVVGSAIGIVSYRLALRLARDRLRAAALTLLGLGGLYALWSERPLLLGVLVFLGLVWLVEVPDSAWSRRPLVFLPVLMWLWVNVHGTWILGFAYLGLHLLGRWLEGAPPTQGRERQLLVAALVAFAVLFVNPYGYALVVFPVQLVSRGDILHRVIEWQSPDFHLLRGAVYAVWIAVLLAAFARKGNRLGRRDLVVTVPFVVLGLWALRNVGIAPLVTLPIAARGFAVPRERAENPSVVGWAVAAMIGMLALGFAVRAANQPHFSFVSWPAKAMRSVEAHGLLGRRVMADEGSGGFVILEYWPRQRVFADDRYDMYPEKILRDYLDVLDATPRWSKVLDEYHVEAVVWLRYRPLGQVLAQSPDWQRVHRDRMYVVYVRRGVPLAASPR